MPAPALPDGTDLVELEEVACRVARAAGRLVVDERPDDLRVTSKSSDTDPVTVMDQRSQELILRLLGEERPDDAVMGEEEGSTTGTSGLTWVVDPIDGTVNYLYGIPAYAVLGRGRRRATPPGRVTGSRWPGRWSTPRPASCSRRTAAAVPG